MLRHPIKLAVLAAMLGGLVWLGFAATGYPSALKPPTDDPALLIQNVRVISMVPGRPEAEEDRTVLVENGVISGIYGPDFDVETEGNDLRIIDGNGRTLLPGLIDAHVHVWDEAELAGYLAYGVTGIRNMSGMPFHLPLAERIEQGRILAPDFMTTGPIINSPGPNQQDNHQLVTTAEEARAAVRQQADEGYRHIKIYSNLLPAPYEALLEEARAQGMTVSGHTPEGHRGKGVPYEAPFEIAFEDILNDGLLTIEHTESIVWHGLRDELDADKMAVLAGKIAASGSTVTPTLVAHANLVRVAETKGAYLDRPGTETINPVFKMFDKGTYDFWAAHDPEPRERPRAAFYLVATRMMHDTGVPLITGSDAGIFTNIPGASLHDELDLLVEAGLTPHEALMAATVTAADVLGFEKSGQIREGYAANFVLVEGDPLTDITLLRAPEAVAVHGHWLDEDALAGLHDGAAQTSRIRTARRVIAMFLSLR